MTREAPSWCLADPKPGEREGRRGTVRACSDHHTLAAGMIVLTDNGLSGRELERYVADQIGVL